MTPAAAARGKADAGSRRGQPAQAPLLRVLSINVHKGMSAWHRRFVLSELRDAVRGTGADIVCLQEVIGLGGPPAPGGGIEIPHYEFLADELWPEYAYGRNAVHSRGHHGNALLSRFPIRAWCNHDASVAGAEPRGLLHAVLDLPGGDMHVICVHLGLGESQRRHQVAVLAEILRSEVPRDAPVIVAGDFNDWRRRADPRVRRECGLESAFAETGDGCPRTFPARFPLLPLDRIYIRGLRVVSARVLSARPWPHLSDHLPLLAEVAR